MRWISLLLILLTVGCATVFEPESGCQKSQNPFFTDMGYIACRSEYLDKRKRQSEAKRKENEAAKKEDMSHQLEKGLELAKRRAEAKQFGTSMEVFRKAYGVPSLTEIKGERTMWWYDAHPFPYTATFKGQRLESFIYHKK
jgi:hypothetical protein